MSVVRPSIRDEAVKAKTGKDWQEWFVILDAAGAQSMSHKEIVAFLVSHYQVEPWWQQMVTVTYEQARGMRARHEMPTGYQVSRSKTFATPVERLFTAWQNETQRAAWLPERGMALRKTSPLKSLIFTWSDGLSNLDINFYIKNSTKTQVVVQHSKLPNPEQAEQMKVYWGEALERLGEFLVR